MSIISGRILHYVFKIGNRTDTVRFYKDVLGMKVLRHEEFTEGCLASCNGPYANRWSKTMIGYGPESDRFALELTYNYGVKMYEEGNSFVGITIRSPTALENAAKHNWPIKSGNILEAPDGFQFTIIDDTQPEHLDPIEKVTLLSSDLQKTINYWNGILGLTVFSSSDKNVVLGYNKDETKLEFVYTGETVDLAKNYGRIAFSCPHAQQPDIEKIITEKKQTILTPLLSLDTPGKETVRVIILADPDGHEICFVDKEGFAKLSEVDPDSDALINRYIAKDKS